MLNRKGIPCRQSEDGAFCAVHRSIIYGCVEKNKVVRQRTKSLKRRAGISSLYHGSRCPCSQSRFLYGIRCTLLLVASSMWAVLRCGASKSNSISYRRPHPLLPQYAVLHGLIIVDHRAHTKPAFAREIHA